MPPKERCRRVELVPQACSNRPLLASYSITRLRKHIPFILVPQSCTIDPPGSSFSLPRSLLSENASANSLTLSCACSFNDLVNRTCRLNVGSDDSPYVEEESAYTPISDSSCQCSNAQSLGPQIAKRLRPVKYKSFESISSTPGSNRTERSVRPKVREVSATAAPRSVDAATSEVPKNSQNKRSQCNISAACRSVATEALPPVSASSSKCSKGTYSKEPKPLNGSCVKSTHSDEPKPLDGSSLRGTHSEKPGTYGEDSKQLNAPCLKSTYSVEPKPVRESCSICSKGTYIEEPKPLNASCLKGAYKEKPKPLRETCSNCSKATYTEEPKLLNATCLKSREESKSLTGSYVKDTYRDEPKLHRESCSKGIHSKEPKPPSANSSNSTIIETKSLSVSSSKSLKSTGATKTSNRLSQNYDNADKKSLKFGVVLPSCYKDVGVDACKDVCPLKAKQDGCACTFPPVFSNIGCTGNIMGSCKCGKS